MAGASRDEAKAAIEKLIASSANDGLKKQAQGLLAQIDRFGDFLTAWQVAGPYRGRDQDTGRSRRVRLPTREARREGRRLAHPPRRHAAGQADDARPRERVRGRQQIAAYARTWVYSAQEQTVRFEFGSDDGNKVWLNGRLVATHPEGGAATPGKFKVNVTLKQGWNAIVIKVTQQTGPWEFCFRICRPNAPSSRASASRPCRRATEISRARARPRRRRSSVRFWSQSVNDEDDDDWRRAELTKACCAVE